MKAKKLAALAQLAAANVAMQKPDMCPPHQFEGGWARHEGDGVIFCIRCGDIRALTPPVVGAPPEEGDREERVGAG